MTAGSYPKHAATLAYAKTQLGTVESPPGSNTGSQIRFYQAHTFLGGTGWPYCVAFALTCWAEGAKRPFPYRTAGAYDLLRWARSNGWSVPLASAVPGDIVVFNVGSGHVGILESHSAVDVHSIDGNHNNCVSRAVRSLGTVAGTVHIPETAVAPPKPLPEPYWVIAGSEDGKRVLVFSQFATQKKVLGMLPRLIGRFKAGGLTVKRGKVRKVT